MRAHARIILATTCLTLLGGTCAQPGPDKPRIAALRGFSSPEELRTYLAEQAGAGYQRSYGDLVFFGAPPAVPTASGAEGTSNDSGSAPTDPFSTTNIQEAGVDESDLVKNNGQTIFALEGQTIHIVRATPADTVQQLSTVTIPATGDSLYLRNNTLIAISRQYSYYIYSGGGGVAVDVAEPAGVKGTSGSGSSGSSPPSAGAPPAADTDPPASSEPIIPPDPGTFTGPQTIVTVIDVTDPARPAVLATVTFEGDLGGSRLIGSKLHLVLTAIPALPPNPTPLALAAMPLEEWIPDYELKAGDGTVVNSGDVAGWQSFFRPEDPNGYGIVTVVTLDSDQPTAPFTTTAISANTGIIYASTNALYLTDTQYDFISGASQEDTIVHKLAFTDGGTDYIASGLVPGRPLNQYSLGEHEGHLRIATTVNSFTGETTGSNNNVYVLGEDGANLATVGSIEGIAPGEQIYAARFIGDRGFLVTFRRIDPLFTLDMSDPANPRVVGELKVPGYSDHIQLLDENHLLTIGKDTQDAGEFAWIEGVALSIFDVTNPASPQLLHKEVIGGRGTSSEANYNPKAFNYFAAKNALAFPVDVYAGDTIGPEYGRHEFTGLYVYRVTVDNGFEFLGRIESSDGVNNGCYYGYYGYTRGVFIGDNVYSVTQTGVKVAGLDDLSILLGETTYPGAPAVQADCFFDNPIILLPEGIGIR